VATLLGTLDPVSATRLDAIRGPFPRRTPDVRVLADFSQNTACQLATLGFAAGVDFGKLLKGTKFQSAFSHSPFAVLRGVTFESRLRENNYALTVDLLREPLGLAVTGARMVNLRDGFPSGPGRMPARLKATNDLLGPILRGDPAATNWLDGAVLRGTIGGMEAFFEADALGVRTATREIRVAEVKSFPKVDDRVDPDQLGSALDQSALYVLLARDAVAALGADPERCVSDRVMLITPRNVGLTPTLSEQRISARVTRMQRVFVGIPNFGDVAASTPADISFGLVADQKADEQKRLDKLNDIADRVGTAYTPSCMTSCANARFCRTRAVRAGDPCVSGTTAVRLLPEILTLGRAAVLTRGATPTTGEGPAATLLERAGRLIDEAAPTLGSPPTPARRTA
jgi:hypothetical protein